MSGRFFRGGRHAFQSAMQSSRANRRPTASITQSMNKFSISFTPASALQATMQSSTPLTGGSGGGAIGSVRTQSTTSTAAAGSKGCGAPSCCGGVTAISSDDSEEPFIGSPYSSTSLSTTNSTAAGGVSAPHAANKNTVADSTGATGTGAAAAPSSSPPPPRTKCDPFEQGGHPLATPVVLQHMRSALDEAWSYDEERKMLLRTFSFLREFGGPDAPPHSDTRALFDFVAALGNVQIHSQGPANHGIYNVNLNLRANSVQVILKTRQLAGCSWADLALGTKVDGIFFRAIMARDAKREMQRKKEQAAAAAAAARVQKTTTTQPESSL